MGLNQMEDYFPPAPLTGTDSSWTDDIPLCVHTGEWDHIFLFLSLVVIAIFIMGSLFKMCINSKCRGRLSSKPSLPEGRSPH